VTTGLSYAIRDKDYARIKLLKTLCERIEKALGK
jgi:hypothetical protein